MKRRILMLLMAMVMMLGMTQVVFADEVKYFEGTVELWGANGIEEIPVLATYSNGYLEFEFATSNGRHIKCWANELYSGDRANSYILLDGTLEMWGGETRYSNDGSIYFGSKIYNQDDYGYFEVTLEEVESQTEPELQQISTPFIGVAESDNGGYTLALAGYFEMELMDGTHSLSTSDIAVQTISIVVYNKTDGKKRVMTQSTVEQMTVTVSGGEVTEYIIRGRVQTDGGVFDRYTATINP